MDADRVKKKEKEKASERKREMERETEGWREPEMDHAGH